MKHSNRSPGSGIRSLTVGCSPPNPTGKVGAIQPVQYDAVTDQQGCRTAGVDPLHPARGDVQTHHLCGDEVVGAELLIDGLVHERVHLGQIGVGPSRVAIGADGHGRRVRLTPISHASAD